ncbi:MAG: YbaN family protein [Alphaproteobacteria bacterium]
MEDQSADVRLHDGVSDTAPAISPIVCRPVRYGLLAIGWLNVTLGVIGLFLPVMPTTIFLLIALWAFSKSSHRFHRWLYNHPTLGVTIRDWHAHRVIPVKAKILAILVMSASLTYITLFVAQGWLLPLALAAGLGAVASFILTRPSRATASL